MVNNELELDGLNIDLSDMVSVLGLKDYWQSSYNYCDEEVFHLELEVNGGLEELAKFPIIIEEDTQTISGALTRGKFLQTLRDKLLQLRKDERLKESPMVQIDLRYNPQRAETKVVVRYNKADKSEVVIGLRGNRFIASVVKYDNHSEGWMYKQCGLCFYRDGEQNVTRDCQIVLPEEKTPKALFTIPQNERMPEKIDGKQVGNYCPNFVDFRAE